MGIKEIKPSGPDFSALTLLLPSQLLLKLQIEAVMQQKGRNTLGPGFGVPHPVVRLYVISRPEIDKELSAQTRLDAKCFSTEAGLGGRSGGVFWELMLTPRHRFIFLQLCVLGNDLGKLGIYLPHLFCRMLLISLCCILTPLSSFCNL